MTSPEALYARWINELWAGRSDDGQMSFTGKNILRIEGDRFAEYWTGTSAAEDCRLAHL